MSMSSLRIVLANSSLAGYPEAGGLWMLYLQYLLGMLQLGHDVHWLELLSPHEDPNRTRQCIARFFGPMREFDLSDRCSLLVHDGEREPQALDRIEIHGRTREDIREIARSADLLWNLCGALRRPLLTLFRRCAFVDLDPGHLQVSALSWDLELGAHQVFLTVGSKINDGDCAVPRLGLDWQPFVPFVYLPLWDVAPDPGHTAPFTSVTQWNWDEVWMGDRVLSISKRQAYLRYLDLPRCAGRPFELAANIHPEDTTGDRDLLQSNGWRLVDPHLVAGSPGAYREYIALSRAELCCPKPIFRLLETGWLSDRSVCYLAGGRPVLMEDTGLGEHLPTGEGLLVFHDMAEAVVGVAEIDGRYANHCRAARELAEQFFDSQRCLAAMLSACGW